MPNELNMVPLPPRYSMSVSIHLLILTPHPLRWQQVEVGGKWAAVSVEINVHRLMIKTGDKVYWHWKDMLAIVRDTIYSRLLEWHPLYSRINSDVFTMWAVLLGSELGIRRPGVKTYTDRGGNLKYQREQLKLLIYSLERFNGRLF